MVPVSKNLKIIKKVQNHEEMFKYTNIDCNNTDFEKYEYERKYASGANTYLIY